jgi:hypothetical protein
MYVQFFIISVFNSLIKPVRFRIIYLNELVHVLCLQLSNISEIFSYTVSVRCYGKDQDSREINQIGNNSKWQKHSTVILLVAYQDSTKV